MQWCSICLQYTLGYNKTKIDLFFWQNNNDCRYKIFELLLQLIHFFSDLFLELLWKLLQNIIQFLKLYEYNFDVILRKQFVVWMKAGLTDCILVRWKVSFCYYWYLLWSCNYHQLKISKGEKATWTQDLTRIPWCSSVLVSYQLHFFVINAFLSLCNSILYYAHKKFLAFFK